MKSKKVLHIKAIGKFSFSFFRDSFSHGESLNLSELFWKRIFSQEYLRHFGVRSKNIELFLVHIEYAREICKDFSERPMNAIELFFVYQLFQNILIELGSILNQWDIHLARGIMSSGNGFTAESLDISICKKTEKNYLYSTIYQLLKETDFSQVDLCVFDVFWPSEIAQCVIAAEVIKQQYPSISFVLNTENANEQFDFSSYIKNLTEEHYVILKNIDFIVTHKGTLHLLLLGLQSQKDFKNIFINTGEYFSYSPGFSPSVSLKNSFLENLEKTEKMEEYIFGIRYTNLRLYPYKCYHSACFFCTINNGNDSVFPHKDLEQAKEYVELILKFIEKNKIGNINFFDEAIHPEILEYFINRIFEKKLIFVYRFRARYLDIFLDKAFVQKLFDSGARYVGVGLETASTRINNMVNKGNSDLDISEKFQVIQNFNTVGIPFHNYSIFGFPQELKEESLLTFKFLANAIEKMDYFTCTPNIYGLMKGSFIYDHPEKFGIEIIGDPTKAVGEFTTNGKKRDYIFLNKLTSTTNSLQFTKFLPHIDANHFWDFIDRSGVFYHFKVQYKKNPYRYHFDYINNILSNDSKQIFSQKFGKTYFFRIIGNTGDRIIQSLISYKTFHISAEEETFLLQYDEVKSIQENRNIYLCSDLFILFLLENFILSNHGEDARSIYH